jgi:hypothetical protein
VSAAGETAAQDALLTAVLAEIGGMPCMDVATDGGALLALIGKAILRRLGVAPEGKATVTYEIGDVTEIRVAWGAPGAPSEVAAAPEQDGPAGQLAAVKQKLETLAADLLAAADKTSPSKKSEIERGCAEAVRGIAGQIEAAK